MKNPIELKSPYCHLCCSVNNKDFLIGIFFGLSIASTGIYVWEAQAHLIGRQVEGEGIFFLIVTVLHMPVAYWAVKTNSNLAWAFMLIGTIAIAVVFGISRSDAAFLVGRNKPGGFGSLSVLSKVIQVGIVIIAGWMIMNNRRAKLNPHAMRTP